MVSYDLLNTIKVGIKNKKTLQTFLFEEFLLVIITKNLNDTHEQVNEIKN